MTITIGKSPSHSAQKPLSTIEKIVKKLNALVDSDNNFFRQGGGRIIDDYGTISCHDCSNIDIHNKVVLFLAAFFDSHYEIHGTYTRFGRTLDRAVEFVIGNEEFQQKLLAALNEFDSAEDIVLKIA